jgi:hypothetical protein
VKRDSAEDEKSRALSGVDSMFLFSGATIPIFLETPKSAGKRLAPRFRRDCITRAMTAPQKPRLEKSELTGSLVLVSPEGTPPLTSERVRELLADFP